jgi:protein N-terminal methyltransferase
VLGGYESVHHCDVDTSCVFIDSFKDTITHGRALDCGAGIGRVTKSVLLPRFAKVDLIEPSDIQIEKAKTFVDSPNVEK